jgi:hypothetical protein
LVAHKGTILPAAWRGLGKNGSGWDFCSAPVLRVSRTRNRRW